MGGRTRTSDLPVPVEPRTTTSGSEGAMLVAMVATFRRSANPRRPSIRVQSTFQQPIMRVISRVRCDPASKAGI